MWSHTITAQPCGSSPAGAGVADTSNVMCRQAILFCVYLLLGAVTTLAVSWACATWSDLLEQTPAAKLIQATPGNGWVRFSRHRGFGARRYETSAFIAHVDASGNATSSHITVRQSGGYVTISGLVGLHLIESPYTLHLPIEDQYWSRLADLSSFDNQSGEFVDEEGAFGWPMLAMWCSYHTDTWVLNKDGTRTWQRARNESLFQPSASLQRLLPAGLGDRPLPLRPIVVGFAADTALYSFAWWFALFVAKKTRRWWRRAKGQCEHCVYDLRGTSSDRCPECGNVGVLR